MRAWSGVGAAYAASYADLCAGTGDAIIRALGPARSRPLLDVGSGTGALGALLADAGWTVTGCEPEQTMREVSALQHPELDVRDGALPSLRFPDASFDAVTANFVLNHVPDPRASAGEMARVAKADATLVATIWTVSPSWFWAAVCERAGLTPRPRERLPADKDFERSATGFGRMLSEGGWHAVEVSEITWAWHAPVAALWASAEGGVASAGAFYLALGAGDRELFRQAFDAYCGENAEDGAVILEHTAAVAVGRAR
ncbi:class I SAM-dependent methyltransferase [Microbacterium sp. YMB-B2]|uniref:Class I SAM-dependent methyltransferase n=1 Tax=Microbacterium tenebrionis TaxID=2830665 RepID=A0A9X1LNZ7_9MICO|nr:class I SAM-dependent methyltransferase [Microbacterium tenebrionis]MCC2029117.1 class I SAM-dependent methyltransferase [Microbacterium tenebrionis]